MCLQQGYAFGHVSLWMYVCVCVCTYIYMWTKKRAVWGLTTRKSPVNVIYCLLVEFNGQKRGYYARQFILGKKFETILLTGREKGPGKLYYGKPRLVYMQCIQQCNANECRTPTCMYNCMQLCRPTISLQVQSVLTVLRAHRVHVLWNSS